MTPELEIAARALAGPTIAIISGLAAWSFIAWHVPLHAQDWNAAGMIESCDIKRRFDDRGVS